MNSPGIIHRKHERRLKIIRFLEGGPMHINEICKFVGGAHINSFHSLLQEMMEDQLVRRKSVGVYELRAE
jgi:DNA-binding HxlR family transcriptional regulator